MRRTPTSLLFIALLLAFEADAGERSFEETIAVEEGAWLEVDCPHGRVYVATWDRSEVEIVAEHAPAAGVKTRQHRGDVRVSPAGEKHKGSKIDYTIQVPDWMNLSVRGNHTDVELDGVQGQVEVDVVMGLVRLFGGREEVYIRNVQGSIEVEGARGNIDVDSQNDTVMVIDCGGEILAESLNGEIRMEGIESKAVEANALNGEIYYSGTMHDDGEYFFMTHDGDIEIGIPRDAHLEVTVILFGGDFTTDFPVEVPDEKNRFKFKLGEGTGRVHVESFGGDIELFEFRPGRRYRRD